MREFLTDPVKVELVTASWDEITQAGYSFTEKFYKRLFAEHPNLAPLFANASLEGQAEKLMAALHSIVESLHDPDTLYHFLRSLGARHEQTFGVRYEFYDEFEQSLMDTFAEHFGERWTPELATAWREAYESIATIMRT